MTQAFLLLNQSQYEELLDEQFHVDAYVCQRSGDDYYACVEYEGEAHEAHASSLHAQQLLESQRVIC